MTAVEEQARSIFLSALERAPEEWPAFLEEVCTGNALLRGRVEQLLRTHEAMGSIHGGGDQRTGVTVHRPAVAERAGTVIGPYKLIEPIGEGGMGTVWMAQQTEPVKRLVALKLIKAGMDSAQVIARFEAERQALALMDHSNIARVLDAGTTSAGRPYFVMDLVKGLPITRYCDEHHFTPRQRLELFIPVCQAVQHAHQKGIIHRDLKPSNVLVALYDDKPVPKVIDFGVAKATGQALTDKTLVTGIGNIVGTLEYMSPEQAEINQLDIDTRSDIYSLGVLLYELLAGSPPFSRQELEKAGMLEMLRVIREQEPAKPSTKLSSSDALPTLSANRGTEPAKLTKLVRGELDWIVMKALEKDRNRRYESANGFAMDVQRYLADEAVQACPPSAGYRLRKFARRNKGPVLAASLVLLVLVAGIIGTTSGMIRATAAEADAKREAGEKTVALGQKEAALATAKANELKAGKQETLAKENAKTAKEQELLARRRFYAAQMNLAQQAWEIGHTARLLELLESQRPKFDQEDLRSFEWYYLWQQCHQHLRLSWRTGHGHALSLALSPDGAILASAAAYGDGGIVKVWNTTNGQEQLVLRGTGSAVWCVAFSPDGKVLASGAADGTLKLWNPVTGQELTTIVCNHVSNGVRSVAFSPDGKTLATSNCENHTVKLWDLTTKKQCGVLKGHTGEVITVAFSPDGKMLATGSGSGDGTVKIWSWDGATAEERVTIPKAGWGRPVRFSPDSKTLATGVDTVELYDVATGHKRASLQGHGGSIHPLAFSPDGKTLASGSEDRTVRIWDLASGQERHQLPFLSQVHSVSFSADGKLLASGSVDGIVKLWELGSAEAPDTFKHSGAVRAVVFSRDGQTLISAGDHPTKLWDVASGKGKDTLPGPIWSGALSQDGATLAARNPDQTIQVWDLTTKQAKAKFPKQKGEAVLSPDGATLATFRAWAGTSPSGNRTVELWNTTTGQLRKSFQARDLSVISVAFSPDGKILATGEQIYAVEVWDAATGKLKLTFNQGESGFSAVHSLQFSPDGKTLATGSGLGTVRLRNVAAGQLLVTLKGHTQTIHSIAFSPDGKTVATASSDQTVKLWDSVTGQERMTLKAGQIACVAFAPDGKTLATASPDGTVKLWRGATDHEATAFRTELDPDDPDGLVALNAAGDRFWNSGESDKTANAYRKAQARAETLAGAFPDSPDYQDESAYSLIALSMLTAPPPVAAPSDRPVAESWRTLPTDGQLRLGRRFLSLGDQLRAAGRFQEALRIYEQLTELMPSDPVVWHQLGHTHDKSGQPEKAITAYSRAIDVDPKQAASWNNRGVLYSRLGQRDKAIADYRQAIILDPNDPVIHFNLRQDLRTQVKPADAIAVYCERLRALGPEHPEAPDIQSLLADIYLSRGNLTEAIPLLEQVRANRLAKFGPDHADTLECVNQLAVAYWRHKQLDQSVPLFEEIVRLRRASLPDGPETYTSIANLGVNYRDAGRLRAALPLFEEVVEWARKQPAPVAGRFAWVTGALGEAYEQDQQFAKAEPFHREALQRARQQFGAGDPRTAGPLALLGLDLLGQRKCADAEPLLRDCLALREKAEPDAWTTFNTRSMLGGCLLGAKKYADAEHLLLQGYEGMKRREAQIPPPGRPRLREAIGRLVQIYTDWGKPEQATQWRTKLDEYDEAEIVSFKEAIELDLKNATLHVKLGLALEKQGKLDEAVVALRQAIELYPKDASSYRSLALLLLDLKKSDAAHERLRKATEKNSSAATAYMILGTVLLDRRKPDEAIACYQQAIELQPNNADSYYQVGITLLENYLDPRAADEAARYLEKGVELDAKHVQCRWALGRARHRQKRLDDAVACFHTCLELDPNHLVSQWSLGFVLLDQKKQHEAVVSFRKAVALNPNQSYAQYGLGRALTELNEQPEEAIAAFRKSIELDPKRADAYHQLGRLLQEQNEADAAQACFRKAIELNPQNGPAHVHLGQILAIQGKTAEAATLMQKGVELNPRHAWSHNELAWLLATAVDPKVREPKAAVSHARTATDLQSDQPNHWCNLGVALLRDGNPKAAVEALEKFEEMTKGAIHSHCFFLAMAYWQTGEKDKAGKAYDKAVQWMDKNQPKNEELRRFRAEAEELMKKE